MRRGRSGPRVMKPVKIPHAVAPGTNLIYQLTNTTFRGPGRYRFLVAVGRHRVALPLRVLGRET